MRKGKVIPSDLSGAKNMIFHAGDDIQEDQVPRGTWDKLVERGYIAPDPEEGSGKKSKK